MNTQSPDTSIIGPSESVSNTTEFRATIQVPDTSYLLEGDYSRTGFDLTITNPAGQQFVVADYFAHEPPPNLVLATGVGLPAEMVRALLHQPFTEDLMFAGPASAGLGTVIGSVKFVMGHVIAIGADGAERELKKGDKLHQGDEIRTDGRGFIRAEMTDGTRFNLGKNSRAVLENFAFDEAASVGNFEAKVYLGGFHYKSGKIGDLNPGLAHSQIKTPSAFISIRGSEGDGFVGPDGETYLINTSGVFEITDINGENAITLDIPGHTSVIVMNGAPSFFETASRTVMELVNENLPPVDPTLDDGTPDSEDDPGQDPASEDPPTDEFTDDSTGPEESGDDTGTGEEDIQDDPDAVDETQPDDENAADDEPMGDDNSGSDLYTGSDGPDSTLFDQDVFDDNFVAGQDGDDSDGDDAGQDGSDDPQQDPPNANDPVEDGPIEPEPELPPTHSPGAEDDALAVTAGELTDLTDLVLANDGEPGQSAIITGVDAGDLEGSLTFEDATLSYIADEESHIALAEGESTTEEFEYTVGVGQITDTAEVTLTVIGVNDAPVSDDVLKVINEDQFRYFNESDFIFDDVDNNAALESVLVTRLPDTGRLYFETTEIRIVDEQEQEFDIVVQVEAGQRFTVEELTSVFYVPLTHANGEDIDRFEFKVSDGMADSEEEYTFSFDALPVQDAPFPIGDHYTIDEDTILSVSAVDGVLANDLEVDGESLTVVDASFLTPDSTPVALFPDGAFEFATPSSDLLNGLSEGETFSSRFAYATSDGVGGTTAATVTITVTGVNDAPVSEIALQHADTIAGEFVLDLLDPQHTNDPDTADQLIIEAVSQDTASGARDLTNLYSVTNGVLSFDTGIFTDLGPGESEILVFDYSVNDQRGADNSIVQSSVSIQVTDGNFAPVAVDDSAQTDEDTPLTLLPLANDSDANPIDQLTLQSVDAAGLAGTVTLSTDGQSVLYTPPQFLAPGESLDDTFSYVVSDGILTDVGTVTITVSGLNDAPQAIPNPQLVPISATAGNVVIPLSDIFADPEPNSVLTVESIDTTGTIGTVSIGSVVYNPAGNFGPLGEGETGIDSFGVTVSDQHGALGSANVILSITGVNDLPTAVADSGTLFATTNNAAFVTGNVLANDTDPDTTDVLQVVGFDASGALGVVTNNGDGTFNYDPSGQFGSLAPGSVASDQFSYTISDGHGGISLGVVTINITGANSPPSGLPVIVGIAVEGSTLTADTSAIADPDGLGVFSYQWFANGVPIPGATAASFAPDQATVNTNVTVDVSYTDGGGTLEVVPSAPVLIANLNDPPTGSVDIDNLAPSQGNMLSVTHTLSDADGLSGPVNYQWQSSPDSGTTWNNVAVGNTLIMTQAEVGKIVRVAASYTDDLGTPETVTSVPTASVININDPPFGNVTITGTAAELSTLTADTSSITDLDGLGTFSYQWFVNSVPISGAVLATFTPTQSEVGGNLTVDVTYTDGFGATETLLSPPTVPVVNVNDPPGGTVDIDNLAPFQGDTLNVSQTLTDPDGLTGPITFQWQGSNDAGSTWFDIVPGPSLVAGEPEVGLLLRVRADYTDDLGTFEQVFSSPTAAVQNVNDSPVLNSAFPLPPIDEGFVASVGIPLSGLVVGFDPDAGGSITGVAVVSNPVSTEGSWEYTTDGGSTWGVITAVDDVGNALALDYALTDMRFNPGFQYSGAVPGLEVRLLDDSFSLFSDSASTPQFLDTSSRGGTTGISTAKGTLTIDVDPVNDSPVITAPSPISGLEDFNIGISGLLVTDADAGTGQLVVDLNVGDGVLTAGLPAAGELRGYGVSMMSDWGASTVPADIPIYVRFDLTNATFDSVVQPNDFIVYADFGPVSASNVTGGVPGLSYAIFTITSPSSNPLQPTSPFDFSVDGVSFTAPSASGDATIAIYSTALDASLQNTPDLYGPVGGIDLMTGDLELTGSQVAVNAALGSLSYLGHLDFNGSDSLFVHVDDQGNTGGMFQTDTGSFTITVTPANDLPVLDFPLNDAGVMRGYPVSIPIAEHFFDADGDPLTFGFSPTLPSGLAFSGGFITGTMTTTVTTSTSTSVTVSVDDGGTPVTDTFQLTIVPFMTNTPPMGSDNLVSTDEDIPYTFERQDFGYSDPESNPFTSVKITSLETVGTLQLNSVDVTLNQVITIADINLGLLTFSTLIPNDSANNYDQFDFTVNDGSLDSSPSNTMTIDVWAVNDPPMIFTPGVLVLNEDQTLAIPDLTIWDDDAGAGALQLELSVGNGQLAVDATSVSATGFDTNVLTPLGVNIAPGTTFYVRYDLANAGFDAALVPGDLSVFEGPNQIFGSSIIAGGGVAETMVIFSLTNTVDPLSDVSDLDLLIDTYGTFGSTASVTRRVYDTSTNALAGGPTGQLSTTSQALGASYLMITGDLSGLGNALLSLTYRPYADFNGTDTLSVTLDDQGNTDGFPQFASTDITLTVSAIDDPPVIQNASIDQHTNINIPVALDQIFVDDVDSPTMNINLTLANPFAGLLNTPAYGGATSTYVAGTGAWSASGTPFELNTVLSQLVFTPAFNFAGSVTLDSSVDDGGAPVTDSLQINVASTLFAINDVVVAEGGTASFTVDRIGSVSGPASVDYVTQNGSATSGLDFNGITSTTLNFADGQATQTVGVTTIDDVDMEDDETFSVLLSNPVNGSIADGLGTATISANDFPVAPTVLAGPGDLLFFEGQTISQPIPVGTFFNPDQSEASLDLSVTGLPPGLIFNPTTDTYFTNTAPITPLNLADVGTHLIQVTAMDAGGLIAVTDFRIDVEEAGAGSTSTLTGTQSITLTPGVDYMFGGGGTAEVFTLTGTARQGDYVDLSGGTDSLILDNSGNTIELWNVESLTAGTGIDVITLATVPPVLANVIGSLADGDSLISQVALTGNGETLDAEFINEGPFTVATTFTISGDGANHVNTYGTTINIANGATFSLTGLSSTFTNNGIIDLQETTGTTVWSSAITSIVNNGTIQGVGTIPGGIVNNGTLAMGASPGTITVAGDLEQGGASRLEVELAGTMAGSESDQLAVTGTATLRGKMDVSLLYGYMPSPGSSFVVLTAGSLVGSFDQVNALDISKSMVLDLNQTASSIELVAVSVDQAGTPGADNLTGTAAAQDVMVGGSGNDVIDGISGNDIIYGQAGDDFILVDSDFQRVDGGAGIDTLAFSDSIDLSAVTGSRVDRVEVLRIADGESQVIELDTDAIKHMVDGHNALTGIANSIVITGDESDLVRLHGDYIVNGEMQLNVDGSGLATYHIYTDGDASVLLSNGLTLEVNYLDGQLVSFESGEVITVNEANSITEDPGSMFSDSLDMDNLENLLAWDSHSSVQDVNMLDIFAADDAFSMEDLLNFAATDSVGAETGTGLGNGQGHEFMSEPVPANGNELASALGGSNVVPFTHSDFATPVDYTDVNLA